MPRVWDSDRRKWVDESTGVPLGGISQHTWDKKTGEWADENPLDPAPPYETERFKPVFLVDRSEPDPEARLLGGIVSVVFVVGFILVLLNFLFGSGEDSLRSFF